MRAGQNPYAYANRYNSIGEDKVVHVKCQTSIYALECDLLYVAIALVAFQSMKDYAIAGQGPSKMTTIPLLEDHHINYF
jgi:hypothetical protein